MKTLGEGAYGKALLVKHKQTLKSYVVKEVNMAKVQRTTTAAQPHTLWSDGHGPASGVADVGQGARRSPPGVQGAGACGVRVCVCCRVP